VDIDKLLPYIAGSTQHQHFYHFTDKRNVDSIRKHGLLCTAELRRLGMFDKVTAGGDAISLASDARNGTDQFVCLCFTSNHPMVYIAANDERQLDAVYLQINPEVIKLPGVKVANAPSNQNGVVPELATAGLGALDLEIIYKWTNWTNPEFKARLDVADKYEILVPKCIPVRYIVAGL
jgi:hypothetical protein